VLGGTILTYHIVHDHEGITVRFCADGLTLIFGLWRVPVDPGHELQHRLHALA
jgi:hypothetical protein